MISTLLANQKRRDIITTEEEALPPEMKHNSGFAIEELGPVEGDISQDGLHIDCEFEQTIPTVYSFFLFSCMLFFHRIGGKTTVSPSSPTVWV